MLMIGETSPVALSRLLFDADGTVQGPPAGALPSQRRLARVLSPSRGCSGDVDLDSLPSRTNHDLREVLLLTCVSDMAASPAGLS